MTVWWDQEVLKACWPLTELVLVLVSHSSAQSSSLSLFFFLLVSSFHLPMKRERTLQADLKASCIVFKSLVPFCLMLGISAMWSNNACNNKTASVFLRKDTLQKAACFPAHTYLIWLIYCRTYPLLLFRKSLLHCCIRPLCGCWWLMSSPLGWGSTRGHLIID